VGAISRLRGILFGIRRLSGSCRCIGRSNGIPPGMTEGCPMDIMASSTPLYEDELVEATEPIRGLPLSNRPEGEPSRVLRSSNVLVLGLVRASLMKPWLRSLFDSERIRCLETGVSLPPPNGDAGEAGPTTSVVFVLKGSPSGMGSGVTVRTVHDDGTRAVCPLKSSPLLTRLGAGSLSGLSLLRREPRGISMVMAAGNGRRALVATRLMSRSHCFSISSSVRC